MWKYIDFKGFIANNFDQVSAEKNKKKTRDGNFARKSGNNFHPSWTLVDKVNETARNVNGKSVSASEQSEAESMEWDGIFSSESSSRASSAAGLTLENDEEMRPIKKERKTSASSLSINSQSSSVADNTLTPVESTARKSTRIAAKKRNRESDSDTSVRSIQISRITKVEGPAEGGKISANSETQEKSSNRSNPSTSRRKPVKDSSKSKNLAASSGQDGPVASASGTSSSTFHRLFNPNGSNPNAFNLHELFSPLPRESPQMRIIAKRVTLTGAVQYLYERR